MVKKETAPLIRVPASSTIADASILPLQKTRRTRSNGMKVVFVAKSSLLSLLFFVILLLTIFAVRQIKLELIREQSSCTSCSNQRDVTLEEVIELVSSLHQNRSNNNESNFAGFLSSDLLQEIHSKKYDNTLFLLHTDGSRQEKLVETGKLSQLERQQNIDNLIGVHNHSIPPIITFTHRYDLLTDNFSFYKKDAKTIKDYENDNDELTAKQREILAYQENVQNIIQLHPESSIRFLNNDDCVVSIYNVMRTLFNNSDIVAYKMIQYFLNEPDGSFKGDLCRGVALYETGGIYLDVDIAMRHSIWKSIQPETEFASPYCHFVDRKSGGFFQAFIGVTQYHPVIERYIRLFYSFYQGTIPNIAEIQKGLYGVKLLQRAYVEILSEQQYQYEMENAMLLLSKTHLVPSNNTNNSIVSTERRLQVQVSKTSEIWYEIVYNKKIFFPSVQRPVWGNSKTCQVVVASRKKTEYKSLVNLIQKYTKIIKYDKNNTEAHMTLQSLLQEQDNSVPMYSRIAYSHRCPML